MNQHYWTAPAEPCRIPRADTAQEPKSEPPDDTTTKTLPPRHHVFPSRFTLPSNLFVMGQHWSTPGAATLSKTKT